MLSNKSDKSLQEKAKHTVESMNEQAKNTAEKIVQDAQSGYETLQARLHDINKDIFAGNTKIPPSASGGQFKYGSAEQQFMEEDAQRGEQLAREKAKLAVPSFSESLYPEETPPRMLQSERLEPIRDFNLLEPSGSIDKLASAVGDAATKVTSALGLGGHHTNPHLEEPLPVTTSGSIKESKIVHSNDPTQSNTSKVSVGDLRLASDRQRLHEKSSQYSGGDMSMKPDLEGAIKVTSHIMTSAGPGESVAEKAKDILDKSTVSELGEDNGVPTTESSANSLGAKLAAPFVGAAKKLAGIAGSTSTDLDEQAKVAQNAMGRVGTQIHDKASEIGEKAKEIGQNTIPLMRQKIGESNENIQDTTHKLEEKIQDTLPKMTKVAESDTTTASVLEKATQMTHNMIESLENAAANLGSYIGIANRPNVVKKGIQIGKEAVQHPELVKKTGSFGMEYGREKASELGEIIIEKASELKETINDKTSPLGQTMTNKGQRLNSPKTTTIIPKVGHSLAEMRQEAMEAIEGTGDKVYNKAKELTEDVYFKGARAWQGSKDSMQEIHDKSIEAGQEALGKGKEIVHEALEKSTDQKLKLEEPPKNTSFFADEDYRLFTESPEPSDFSSWDEAEKVAFQRARQAHERKAH